jgi:hypothetical protein
MKTRKITILSAVLVALTLCSATSAQAVFTPASGDMNVDGVLNAADAAMMLRALETDTLTIEERPDCDFTQNGMINDTDVRAALFYACGGISDMDAFGERVSSGLCDESLFDHFWYSGILNDGNGNYKSENVSVTISEGYYKEAVYHIADIYIQDISCFANAFSSAEYKGRSQTMETIFDSTENAIVAINGDFYSLHERGPIVRDGVIYTSKISRDLDLGLLLTNGEFLTYRYRLLTKDAFSAMEVYQSWVFGPALLDDEGHAKTQFRSSVTPRNPRSVLGYYEPGHYVFLAVDGRSSESRGLAMKDLSLLCEDLGLTSAYNLDGGQSSVMQAENGPVNVPYAAGRPVSDALVICELASPDTARAQADSNTTDASQG